MKYYDPLISDTAFVVSVIEAGTLHAVDAVLNVFHAASCDVFQVLAAVLTEVLKVDHAALIATVAVVSAVPA